jgi:CheY-like chemotaxis protein
VPASANPGTEPALDGVKLLVVDDDGRSTELMRLLDQTAAETTIVTSGAAALAALGLAPDVDVVIVAVAMPVTDRYDIIRAIRATEAPSVMPLIAVSNEGMPGERSRCLEAGASDYVRTPNDVSELVAALRTWLPSPVKLPVEPSDPNAPAARETNYDLISRLPAAVVGSSLVGLRFLVVDDDYRNLFAMRALLERGEASVTVAESGAEALAILDETSEIDVVLMDIMMPTMDGYDTIRAMRAINRLAALPVVAVTGKAAAGERQRCLDAGADDYIPKPVNTADLLSALKPWLPPTEEPAA